MFAIRNIGLLAATVLSFSTLAAENKPQQTPQVIAPAMSIIEQGKAIVFNPALGNCLACHQIADGETPGNIGPSLENMQARYPDKALLYQQIWDASKVNPDSIMPPFGRHGILSAEEMNKVVEFLYSL